MESSDYIYNGKRFRYPSDFEQEFKPTKWSIRKFMTFLNGFEEDEKYKFANNALHILGHYHTSDRDTLNFIRQIKDKKSQNFGVDKFMINLYRQNPVIVQKEKYSQLIYKMTELKNDGIIEGTAKNLAEILKNNFGLNLSLSTIVGKIYDSQKKINENNLDQ